MKQCQNLPDLACEWSLDSLGDPCTCSQPVALGAESRKKNKTRVVARQQNSPELVLAHHEHKVLRM